ncbi:chemotaxis protein CheB [Porifericola rhodea]|uniref:CheR family methyltransferase n=1 Tax=Porifericola rhodea TaxID=930972 RepID=UPI002666581C|nr:CheR family methyltransferase [Porifericola rhodea]WKN32863.1 chemotaxis protein CheB [Porifericola rhodea]
MSKTAEKKHLFIAGIGASAGGLTALSKLVANLPYYAPEVAIIVAQHLSPDYRSKLTSLLERVSRWPVLVAADGLKLEGGKVYVTPERCEITVENEHIKINELAHRVHPLPSADMLFKSIAQGAGSKSIGIILSGTGRDGTEGARAIKKQNGYVIAQEPEDAQQQGMPASAINAGAVDKILSAEEIGPELKHLLSTHPLAKNNNLSKEEHSLQLIFDLLAKQTGTNFSRYKLSTIERRVNRRLEALQLSSVSKYYEYIQNAPEEIEQLFNTVLIGVTSFFRDEKAYGALREYLRKVIHAKRPGDTIRVWSVGCSSGEEPYSIAMLLDDLLGEMSGAYSIQIFATDIDENGLNKGRKGFYSHSQVENLSDEVLSKYFEKVEGGYQVRKSIRQRVLFSKHDITTDPPFMRLDMISCRNVFIYFNQELQREVIPLFHYALLEGGYLLLGKSESISDRADLFKAADSQHKIYYRKEGVRHMVKHNKFRSHKKEGNEGATPPRLTELSLEEVAKETLVHSFEHPYVVIDERMEVAYIKGRLQPFVELEEGSLNTNLLSIINKSLHTELRVLLAKTKKTNTVNKSSLIRYQLGEVWAYVRISMSPLLYSTPRENHYLVIFELIEEDLRPQINLDEDSDNSEAWKDMRIIELEQELSSTKDHLHTFTEALETSNEELQALNEELLSTNEELKSANEEMETSNEELHSANDELSTANTELARSNEQLQIKEHQLMQTKEDLEISREKFYLALENSNIILFHQDEQLRYIWIYNAYSRIEGDALIGLNDLEISDFPPKDAKRLHEVKQEVLRSGKEIEVEVQVADRWYILKIKPIIRSGKVRGINGVGIDITDRKEAADEVAKNQSILSSIINQGADNMFAISTNYDIIMINDNAKKWLKKRLGVELNVGDSLMKKLEGMPDKQEDARQFFGNAFVDNKVTHTTYESTDKEGKNKRYYDAIFFPIMYQKGEILGAAYIGREITERVLLEQRVQEITKKSANLVGNEFFKGLTRQLASIFRMKHVYVGVFQEGGKSIKTLAFREDGKLTENFTYTLDNTPCEQVVETNTITYIQDVAEKFPQDEKLKRWSAESYVGVPITSPNKEESVGVLVMIDKKPWKNNPYTDYLLTLLSIRAGAELNRISAEQKIKEKSRQLNNVSSNVPGILYEFKQAINGDVKFTYISEACKQVFEVEQSEFINSAESFYTLVLEEDRDRLVKEQTRARRVKDFFHFEGRFITKISKQLKWIKINANCQTNEDGSANWYGFMDDITPLKETEAALEEAKNEAEKAARAKEDFLATMSHEIRTPLNAIIGLSNLLLRKNPREDQLENFKALKFSSENLMNLINDILDYSKVEAGKVEIEESEYNIKVLLDSIKQTHSLYANERNNRLEVKVGKGVPRILKGDQVKLAQILNNLVSNANKFTQNGKVSITVDLDHKKESEVSLNFSVKDTGIGISKANLNKIFEKFTQADSSTVRHYGGTGLGLAITKALLEMQGSQIQVESEEGVGSRFYFSLHQQVGKKRDLILQNEDEEYAAKDKQKKVRILLVEDVAINRMVVQQYFDEWWNSSIADEATNGLEALELVQKNDYDIILMDIRMPKMDGYEASEAIRKLGGWYEKIPIIALTADTNAEFRNDKRAAFIDDVVTKPFNPQNLYRKISQFTSFDQDETPVFHRSELPAQSAKNGIEPNFNKAEEPFKEAPHKIVKFYEMAIRSIEAYRANYFKALEEQNHKLISESMHKVKVLIDMLGLQEFYQEMYSTRKKMEAGASAEELKSESDKINSDINKLLQHIQQRLQVQRSTI